MCRSNSTQTIRLDHISCEDDSVGFTFYKTKKEQEGTYVSLKFYININICTLGVRVKDAKHCFANPFKPATCLFVALGIYFACTSTLQPGYLFVGSNQKVSIFQYIHYYIYYNYG